jgi:hypothetical protein
MMRGELDVPLAFACAPESLKTFATSAEVSPLPADAFARGKLTYHSSRRAKGPAIRDLDPVGWTAVMVHAATSEPQPSKPLKGKTRFRVALVRSKHRPVPISEFAATTDKQPHEEQPRELEIVDLQGFLELTAPEHAGDLKPVLSDLTAWAKISGGELVSNMVADEVNLKLGAFATGTSDLG